MAVQVQQKRNKTNCLVSKIGVLVFFEKIFQLGGVDQFWFLTQVSKIWNAVKILEKH